MARNPKNLGNYNINSNISNLTVSGSIAAINTVDLDIKDNIITLNKGETGVGVSLGSAGIIIDRGSATNYKIAFDETTQSFQIGAIDSLQKVATRENTPTGGAIPVWNSVSNQFDTALGLTASITNQLKNIGSTTISGTQWGYLSSATAINTSSTLVLRDSSGNFAASNITASLTGHASLDLPLTGGTLTNLLTLPNLTINTFSTAGILHNDSTGIVSSSLLKTADLDTTANLQIANGYTTATSSNTTNAIVARDASGGFSVGTITATKITTATTELVLEQTGDSLGTTRLRLQNRNGVNGAMFENAGLDLVDFIFNPSTAVKQNIRYEHRSANLMNALNTGGEFQIGLAANPSFYTGPAATAVRGTATFSTGTGAVSLNGDTTVASGKTLTLTGLSTGILHSTAGVVSSSLLKTADLDTTANLQIANGYTTATSANTTNAIVTRDGSGNFTAGTITASLTGHASLDLALTGGTITGAGAGALTLSGAGNTTIEFTGNSGFIDIGIAAATSFFSNSALGDGIFRALNKKLLLGTVNGLSHVAMTTGTATNTTINSFTFASPAEKTGTSLAVVGGTINDTTAGGATLGNYAMTSIAAPTLTNTTAARIYTNAASLYIAGNPVPSTGITITNPYALYTEGNVLITGTTTMAALTQLGAVSINASGSATTTIGSSTAPTTLGGNTTVAAGKVLTSAGVIHCNNQVVNKVISLWDNGTPATQTEHSFYGFGINGNTLRYQTAVTAGDHVFYAATSASASNELFRISGTGNVSMGNTTSITQIRSSINASGLTCGGTVYSGAANPTTTISTAGTTTLTGVNTNFTSAMMGGVLYVNGGSTPYIIINWNSATQLTLNTAATFSATNNYEIWYGGLYRIPGVLQFNNQETTKNKLISLFDSGTPSNQTEHTYYGFGINPSTLRYQVVGTTSHHVFYASTSASASNELFRISGNYNVSMNTAQAGTFSTGTGLVSLNGDTTVASGKRLTVAGTESTISSTYSGSNEIVFSDNGQIRSLDNNHRIIFDRPNGILELREWGSVLLSAGATTGLRTSTAVFNPSSISLNQDTTIALNKNLTMNSTGTGTFTTGTGAVTLKGNTSVDNGKTLTLNHQGVGALQIPGNGSDTQSISIQMGTSGHCEMGMAGGGGQFFSNDSVSGDFIFRQGTTTKKILIGVGSTTANLVLTNTRTTTPNLFSTSDSNLSGIAANCSIYQAGTISTVGDSSSIIGVGTVFPPSCAGGLLYVNGNNFYYNINTWVSNTEITLTVPITLASTSNYQIYYGGTFRPAGNIDQRGASTVSTGTGAVSLNGAVTASAGLTTTSTAAVNISDDAVATTIKVGTGAAVKNVTIGSTAGASSTTIQAGSGGVIISGTLNSVGNWATHGSATYTTGTASQSGTTITGVGTTFPSAAAGGLIVFGSGQYSIITAYISGTTLTALTSQTVSSTTYTLYYSGTQIAGDTIGAIKLPTSDGIPSTLNYYEEYTWNTLFTPNGTSPVSSGSTPCYIQRIGNQVHLTVRFFSCTSGSSGTSIISSSVAFPIRFSSPNGVTAAAWIQNGTGIYQLGLISISDTTIQYNINPALTAFTNSATIGNVGLTTLSWNRIA